MRQLVDTEEAARILGISYDALKKRFRRGKIEGEFVPGSKGGGRSGQVLKVWINNSDGEIGKSGDGEKKPNPKDRFRVHRGEPGCHEVTSLLNGELMNPTGCHERLGMSDPTNRANRVCDPLPLERGDGRECGASTGLTPATIEETQHPEDPAGQCTPATLGVNLPAIIDKGISATSPKALRIANLRFALIQAFQEEATKNHPLTPDGLRRASTPKEEIIQRFLNLYHSGLILPDVRTEIKKLKRSTLYNWLQLYDQGGIDALATGYRGAQATPITEAEKNYLLTKLLDQNKPTIGDTINKCKFLLGEASPSNPSKLRRFINDFRRNNYDLWTLEREGEKALNDKCVPYAEREWRDLAVGEAVVADGHKLNFQVINPFTGKPSRAVMVLFWDWKSSYPLGWEIMLTESIQCVVAALRNAIITLGKFPKHALLDNGKAFRANVFTKQFRFQETEIPGIFDKLNILPHFAMPYNAQSKPVERFFRTFNDWFERELPSYTGASINDKPAHMNRNEKRAKALHDEWTPTIPEAMELIFRWREYYSDQPLKARDGARPRNIFEAEKGPGVDPFALHFLMMSCKARMVHRNGITFNGCHWFHENLYGFKDYVLMFYSYYDLSQVYVFTMQNEFLCAAKPVEKLMPFAADSEFPEDMAAVQRINAIKRKAVRTTKNLADMLQSQKQIYIDWDKKFRDRPEVAEAIKKIEDKRKPKKIVSLSTQEEIENFEIRSEAEAPAQFGSFSERYEYLIHKPDLSDTEKKWIHQFKTGQIAPGEYDAIFGGGENASQIHHYEERQKICVSG